MRKTKKLYVYLDTPIQDKTVIAIFNINEIEMVKNLVETLNKYSQLGWYEIEER